MTGRLPRGVSGKQTVAALRREGFVPINQVGDHVTLRTATPRPGGRAVVVVPLHRELADGTLRSILRHAGLTAQEFGALLGCR